MKMNCLILDDEPIARDILESYLRKLPEFNLVKSCKSVTEAYEVLYEEHIDLIFLDIQMPAVTGMEFLISLRNPPMVIFTTAYSHFAVEGFERNAVDYLLKPVTFDRFYLAVEKAIEKFSYRRQGLQVKPDGPDYIFIKQDSKLIRVDLKDISYIRAEKDFAAVCLGEKELLASQHLKMFEKLLPAARFLRIHRSYMVNVEKITAIKGNGVELHGQYIPVGPNYRQQLMVMLRLNGEGRLIN